jgi:pilus assembly protein CpaF
MIDWRQLYDHQMRATPDHVIFGEISTQNAFAALGALNSGITGFMCTIHAESPYQVINRKFDQNIAWAGQNMPRIAEFLSELVDVIVQIKRDTDGFRRITDIYEPRNDRWVMRDGKMLERVAA